MQPPSYSHAPIVRNLPSWHHGQISVRARATLAARRINKIKRWFTEANRSRSAGKPRGARAWPHARSTAVTILESGCCAALARGGQQFAVSQVCRVSQAETGNGHNLQHRGRRQRRALARPNVARKTPGTDVARHAAPCAAFLAATAFLILGPPWWCGGLSLFSSSSRRRLLIRADASALITPIVTASVTIGLLMRNVPWLA